MPLEFHCLAVCGFVLGSAFCLWYFSQKKSQYYSKKNTNMDLRVSLGDGSNFLVEKHCFGALATAPSRPVRDLQKVEEKKSTGEQQASAQESLVSCDKTTDPGTDNMEVVTVTVTVKSPLVLMVTEENQVFKGLEETRWISSVETPAPAIQEPAAPQVELPSVVQLEPLPEGQAPEDVSPSEDSNFRVEKNCFGALATAPSRPVRDLQKVEKKPTGEQQASAQEPLVSCDKTTDPGTDNTEVVTATVTGGNPPLVLMVTEESQVSKELEETRCIPSAETPASATQEPAAPQVELPSVVQPEPLPEGQAPEDGHSEREAAAEVDDQSGGSGESEHHSLGDQDTHSEVIIWEIKIPKHLVGRFIGKQGRYINCLKQTSGVMSYIFTLPYTEEFQICHIEGTQQQVGKALTLISEKFKHLDLTNLYSSPPLPIDRPSLPTTTWHTHPMHHALRSLDQQMFLCYSQPGAPALPSPVEVGTLCAAPAGEGAWWRAQVIGYCKESNEVEIRYIDYGGYNRAKHDTLRQLRSDFVTLPFQGTEVLLDNLTHLTVSNVNGQHGLGCQSTHPQSTEFVIWEVKVPKHLVGRFIGSKGNYVRFLKQTSGVKIYVCPLPYTQEFQICHIEGTQQQVVIALTLINQKFKHLDLTNQYTPPPLPISRPAMPMTSWLLLPSSMTVEVSVVNIVSAGHVFVQQHTHPTCRALRSLNQQMVLCYSQPNAPPLLSLANIGSLCAAPAGDGTWRRAQVYAYYEDPEEVVIRYVDYGGYICVKLETLRQLRKEFVSLPFQGIEVLLDKVAPLPGTGGFSAEANAALEKITRGESLLAQVTSYDNNTGLPLIKMWKMAGNEVVSVNHMLAELGHVTLVK